MLPFLTLNFRFLHAPRRAVGAARAHAKNDPPEASRFAAAVNRTFAVYGGKGSGCSSALQAALAAADAGPPAPDAAEVPPPPQPQRHPPASLRPASPQRPRVSRPSTSHPRPALRRRWRGASCPPRCPPCPRAARPSPPPIRSGGCSPRWRPAPGPLPPPPAPLGEPHVAHAYEPGPAAAAHRLGCEPPAHRIPADDMGPDLEEGAGAVRPVPGLRCLEQGCRRPRRVEEALGPEHAATSPKADCLRRASPRHLLWTWTSTTRRPAPHRPHRHSLLQRPAATPRRRSPPRPARRRPRPR